MVKHNLQFMLGILTASLAVIAFAAPPARTTDKVPSIQVQVEQYRFADNLVLDNAFLRPHFASDNIPQEAAAPKQYDAALYYPVSGKGLDMGFGVNIRMINGITPSFENGQPSYHNFSEAIPMFYASALLDLPFKGLSAGFEGRHSDSLTRRSFDYKAKLNYEWNRQLGFEGGWQHQQYADDKFSLLPEDSESNSLFLDLRLKF